MMISNLNNIVILTKPKYYDWFQKEYEIVTCYDDINYIPVSSKNALLSCNTGIIIPEKIFKKFLISINIHPGSFEFPGRDPHHWACYKNSSKYGATAHIISKDVDQGKIIDYELVDINKNLCPSDYKNIGNNCAKKLSIRVIKNLLSDNIYNKEATWSNPSKKRSDLLKMCKFEGLDKKEIKKRMFAFKGFEKFFSS